MDNLVEEKQELKRMIESTQRTLEQEEDKDARVSMRLMLERMYTRYTELCSKV